MQNRFINALVKTLCALVALHIPLLVLGYYWGGNISVFGWPMYWPHWESAFSAILAIVLCIIIFLLMYFLWPPKSVRDRSVD